MINIDGKNILGGVTSAEGSTTTLALGAHAEIAKPYRKPLLVGLQVAHTRYEFPRRKKTYVGELPLATFELKWNESVTLFAAVPPSKKKEERAWVFGFNHSF